MRLAAVGVFIPLFLVAVYGAAAQTGGNVVSKSDLPFASGKTFLSLDDYLAYLEEISAMDLPYYRKLPDGRYEYMTGRAQRGRQGELFTRQQLLDKFGFAR